MQWNEWRTKVLWKVRKMLSHFFQVQKSNKKKLFKRGKKTDKEKGNQENKDANAMQTNLEWFVQKNKWNSMINFSVQLCAFTVFQDDFNTSSSQFERNFFNVCKCICIHWKNAFQSNTRESSWKILFWRCRGLNQFVQNQYWNIWGICFKNVWIDTHLFLFFKTFVWKKKKNWIMKNNVSFLKFEFRSVVMARSLILHPHFVLFANFKSNLFWIFFLRLHFLIKVLTWLEFWKNNPSKTEKHKCNKIILKSSFCFVYILKTWL